MSLVAHTFTRALCVIAIYGSVRMAPEAIADGVASSSLPLVPDMAGKISRIKDQTAPPVTNVAKIGEGYA